MASLPSPHAPVTRSRQDTGVFSPPNLEFPDLAWMFWIESCPHLSSLTPFFSIFSDAIRPPPRPMPPRIGDRQHPSRKGTRRHHPPACPPPRPSRRAAARPLWRRRHLFHLPGPAAAPDHAPPCLRRCALSQPYARPWIQIKIPNKIFTSNTNPGKYNKAISFAYCCSSEITVQAKLYSLFDLLLAPGGQWGDYIRFYFVECTLSINCVLLLKPRTLALLCWITWPYDLLEWMDCCFCAELELKLNRWAIFHNDHSNFHEIISVSKYFGLIFHSKSCFIIASCPFFRWFNSLSRWLSDENDNVQKFCLGDDSALPVAAATQDLIFTVVCFCC
jgi:hypothetical protein